ncbi:hypothetical protein NL676_011176 [Syzygium grande]|nr:hypothetical protein NL676_011176 [Syzygium grande]
MSFPRVGKVIGRRLIGGDPKLSRPRRWVGPTKRFGGPLRLNIKPSFPPSPTHRQDPRESDVSYFRFGCDLRGDFVCDPNQVGGVSFGISVDIHSFSPAKEI